MPETAMHLAASTEESPVLSSPPAGWITAEKAAAVLGCTARTVRNRLAAGRIRGSLVAGPSGDAWWVDPLSDAALSSIYAPAEHGLAGLDAARLTARQRDKAAGRLEAVLHWQGFRRQLPPGSDIQARFADWSAGYAQAKGLQRPVSWATMWRWVTAMESGQGIVELAPRHAGTRPDEPDARAWAFFQTLFLTKEARSLYDCWRQTAAQAGRQRWDWISYRSCSARVQREIPRATLVYYREGPKACEDTCVPYGVRDYDFPSNTVWSVDHHQLDVACVNPATGRPDFPWITTWQDVRSRYVVGWMMHFGPNLDVVLASLRRALLVHGVPVKIIFDNGKEFRAQAFTGGRKLIRYEIDQARVRCVMAHLAPVCTVSFAQPYNAKAKPNERQYRTTRMQFSQQWQTYRGNNTVNRPEGVDDIIQDYQTNGIVPAAAQLESAYGDWLEHAYHRTSHRGRGMDGRCPAEVYQAELRTVTRVSEDELILLMMRVSEPLTVARNGIRMWGHWFNAPELFGYLGKKVYARYDAREIGRLYVHTLKDELVCVASRKDLLGFNASHDDIRTLMRSKASVRRLAKAYKETSELLTGNAIENIALQRQAAAAEQAARPTPPDGDGDRAPTLRIFRTVLADTAEQLASLPAAAGGEVQAPAASRRDRLRAVMTESVIDVPATAQPAQPSADLDDPLDHLRV